MSNNKIDNNFTIGSFLSTINSNKAISFFSINQRYRPIRPDISLKSHPHNDPEYIYNELKERFAFVERVWVFNNKLSARPKKEDICIGILYSNIVDVKKIIKESN